MRAHLGSAGLSWTALSCASAPPIPELWSGQICILAFYVENMPHSTAQIIIMTCPAKEKASFTLCYGFSNCDMAGIWSTGEPGKGWARCKHLGRFLQGGAFKCGHGLHCMQWPVAAGSVAPAAPSLQPSE